MKNVAFLGLFIFTAFLYNVVLAGLFKHNENGIQVLTAENYTLVENETSVAWVVNFYLNWCGHCQRFAPTFKSLADSIRGWKIIKPGAVDCAERMNADICRANNITAVPVLRMFSPKSSSDNQTVLEIMVSKDIEDLRSSLVTGVIEMEYLGYSLSGCTELDPLNAVGYDEFITHKQSNFHLLLFEKDNDSYLGAKSILDFCSLNALYPIPILPVSHNHSLVGRFFVTSFPELLFKSKGKSYKSLLRHTNRTAKDVYGVIKNLAEKIYQIKVDDLDKPPETTDGEIGDIYIAPEGVYMEDLEKSLNDFLTTDLVRTYQPGEDKKKALTIYLTVLNKYIPYRPQVHAFLDELIHRIDQAEIQDGADIARILSILGDEGYKLPTHDHFIACRGSQPRWRGYPCSLWTTFHTLLANEYLQKVTSNGDFDVMESVTAVHGFVKNFFGCTDCANNFLKDYQLTSTEINKIGDPVMWLWRKHNRVNKRLKGDPTEDPVHPKIFFPAEEMCPLCFIANSNQTNDKEIFNFLIDFYRPESIKTMSNEDFDSVTSDANSIGMSYQKTKYLLPLIYRLIVDHVLRFLK